jgi:hypothetical protein
MTNVIIFRLECGERKKGALKRRCYAAACNTHTGLVIMVYSILFLQGSARLGSWAQSKGIGGGGNSVALVPKRPPLLSEVNFLRIEGATWSA